MISVYHFNHECDWSVGLQKSSLWSGVGVQMGRELATPTISMPISSACPDFKEVLILSLFIYGNTTTDI